jgi:hypothetical protein
MEMDIVFVTTHLIMALCIIAIFYEAIADSIRFDQIRIKESLVSICVKLKLKYIKVVNSSLFRIATSCFIALTQLNSNN